MSLGPMNPVEPGLLLRGSLWDSCPTPTSVTGPSQAAPDREAFGVPLGIGDGEGGKGTGFRSEGGVYTRAGHHPTPWSQDRGRAERLSVLQWLPPCRSGPGCSEWRQLPLDTQVSRLVSVCMDRAQSRSARRQGCPTSSHGVCASSADALWGTGAALVLWSWPNPAVTLWHVSYLCATGWGQLRSRCCGFFKSVCLGA